MDNQLITLIGLLVQDRVDRANAELQTALKFQERVTMLLSGVGGASSDDKGTMAGVSDTDSTMGGVPPEVNSESSREKKEAAPRTEGRKRKAGSMVENMISVMGDTQAMTAGEVAEALEAAGLAPDSNNLKGYISSAFSSTTNSESGEKVFQKVSRGKYIVASFARQAEEEPTTEVESTSDNVFTSPADQILAEQGLNIGSFSQAPSFS